MYNREDFIMREITLAYNPDTGRCHGVKNIPASGEGIRITEIPKEGTLAEVCMLVEKRPDIRQRGHGVYAELLKKTKQRKAG